MSRTLGVSRSGYYKWLKNKALREKKENRNEAVRSVFAKSKNTYGSPRIALSLKKEGYTLSRATVGRCMKNLNLKARKKRKFVHTTDSKHKFKIAKNLLNREFDVEQINKVWVSDITYIPTDKGWRYLTIVLDLADRMIVSWVISERMDAESTVIKAFEQAVKNRGLDRKSGLMFHSDRGVQYACDDFKKILKKFKVKQSMSRKGNCWDNAVAESFFKTIKTERLDELKIIEEKRLYSLIFRYIEGWYNTQRIHTTLGDKTPLEMFYLKSYKLAA